MASPAERVETLRQETADFKRRLAALPPEAWEQPSACAGWTVADVVAHLAGQDFALRVSRGLQGDASPPAGAPPVAEHDEDRFAESIFQRAFATRSRLGEGLLESLEQRLDEAVAVFAGVAPEQWELPCYWPPGPEPVRTLLDMRISELAMHAWDVCSRFDPDYRLSAASVAVLLDTVPRAVRRAFRPAPGLTRPQRFRFLIRLLNAPAPACYDLVFSAAGVNFQPTPERAASGEGAATGTAAAADVLFRCDGETCVMTLYGRLTPAAAMASGRLTYEGDEELARSFGARFQGG